MDFSEDRFPKRTLWDATGVSFEQIPILEDEVLEGSIVVNTFLLDGLKVGVGGIECSDVFKTDHMGVHCCKYTVSVR